MKKTTKYFTFSLLLVLLLSACNSATTNSDDGLFQYKESLIGNNSAVINIIGQLWHAEKFEEVALQTKSEPYGMTITYKDLDAAMADKEYKETVVYNASYLFALIDNAEWIVFDFDDRQYEITKSALEDWYNQELSDFTDEEELEALIQEKLNDENEMKKFFKQ